MNIEDVKNDWLNTVEKQIVNSETQAMVDSIRRDAKYSSVQLTVSDKEIITVYAMCKMFIREAESRNETLKGDRWYNLLTNFIYIYENESFESFYNKIEVTKRAMRQYGLNKELQAIKLDLADDISFVSLFKLNDYEEDTYLVVNLTFDLIQTVTKSKVPSKKFVFIYEISFKELIVFINAMFDYTGLSIKEIMLKYINIPPSAVNQMQIEGDEFGLKKHGNYYAYCDNRHTTSDDLYLEQRKDEIEERLNTPYEPKLLPYPWGII